MRKLFIKFSMMLLVLVMSTNAAWGDGIGDIVGGLDPANPATWFYVNLNARVSNPSCGTNNPGTVWLITTEAEESRKQDGEGNDLIMRNHLGQDSMVLSTDTKDQQGNYVMEPVYIMERKAHNPSLLQPEPTVPEEFNSYESKWEVGYNEGKEDAGTQENYDADWNTRNWGWDCDEECIAASNAAASAGYKAGFDWIKSDHYLNTTNPVGFASTASLNGYSLLYAPGMEDFDFFMTFSSYAYFYGKAKENDGWYFTGWSYTEGESDLGGVVGEADSTMFRVLPSATPGEANKRIENVYATFKPVLVADYKVGGMINVGTEATNFGETTVVFDVVGERVSTADFTASVEEANFTATITSCINNKVTVTVRYTNPGAMAENVYRGNVKLASKSGCSELTAAVFARVGGASANEATLYDGKTPTENSGTLKAMIAAANGTDLMVVLNRDYTAALNVNATVTIDLNGYNMKALTVSGGEVTIAYNKYGGRGTAASVTAGKLILNGAEFASLNISAGATVEQNGALITGAVTNNGTFVATEGHVEGGLSSAGTLTINGGKFEGATAITVTGGTATINKATVSGTEYGIRTTGGATEVTSKLVTVYGGTNAVYGNGGTIQLNNGKYDASTPLAGTIDLQAGYFKADGEHLGIAVPEGKKVLNVLAGTEFAEGYRYFIGDDATGVGVCRIGTTSYATLEAALAYANNNPSQDVVIIMTNDYTLPAGYYTLPARATLIVPMSDEQETGYEIVNRVSNNSVSHTDYVQPYEFRRLTFAYGVNMDVHGTIELSGTQRASDDGYAAMPHGPYGHLVMEEGSHMTLQNGALLRAWGFMTGKGETDARRGSKVREQFQMGDWKGGSISFAMLADDRHVFPITQYFIQNVESPVKYHPGALLSTTTSVSANFGSMGITAMANDIVVVGVSGGDPAMFFMDQEADAENTWVRKWYDAEHDVQTYDVNSGAHIGSMVLDLGKLGTQPLVMNSATFVLPITNNMKIHLLSGQMDFTQTTALLPGAEVEVDKESTVTIYTDPDDLSTLSSFESQWRTYESEHSNWEADPSIGEEPVAPEKPILSTGELFVYDADEWGNYAKGKGDTGTKFTKVVKYSPSWDGALVSGKPADGKPNVRHEDACPDDATINVHGTFNTGDGAVYTTAGGANIYSSNEDAGSFIVNRPTPTYTAKIYQVANASASSYKSTEAVSAKLKNGAGAAEAYTATAGKDTNLAFLYRDNTWQNPIKDNVQTFYFDCYTAEVDMAAYVADVQDKFNNIAIYHAPDNIAECLAIMSEMKINDPATANNYRSNESFMSMVSPQIEAMREAGYDLGGAVQHIYIKPQEWLEIAAQAHIKLNFDPDYIEELEESYDAGNYADAVSAYMEYVEACANNPYLEGVTGNADHTYSDADGAGRLFILMKDGCQWWEVENVNNLYHCIHPNNDTYYYWQGAYRTDPEDEDTEVPAHWEEKRFTITWLNWDGTEIKTYNYSGPTPQEIEYSVTYGTMAEYLGTNPTREANIDYTYDFAGWSPALGPVTSDVTYTATFTEKPRMYTVIFQQEGGVEIERHFLTHNEIPVCENVPTKVGHTLQWDPAIAAVTGDATYTATWLENPPTEYEVTFFDYDGTTVLKQSDVAVGEVPVAPAIVDGKPQKDESFGGKPATNEFTYVFDHWAPALEEVSATSIKSYTAVYREVDREYTISYFKEDGVTPNTTKASESLPYGATPTPPAVTKENPATGHTYTLVWKTLDETGGIQTVMGHASYKPTYLDVLNKYTVTVKSNPSGACSSTGAGLYDYNSSATITLAVNDGYTFTGWSDGQEGTNTSRTITVTEDKELVANFTVAEPDYTIIWNNEDGSLIYSIGQKANTATIFTGAIPTKDATAEKTYTFYGWTTRDNEGHNIDTIKNGLTPKATADATYYAYFNEEARKYTISWKNENGTDIEVDYNQPYGATIEYNSATPTKQATEAATYAFDGWSTSQGGEVAEVPTTVSGDAAFYAHFAATPKTYTVTWKRDDGSLLGNTEVAYGELPSHADPIKPATPQYSYTFTGWDRDFEPVEGLTSYTASFSSTLNTYTITWMDGDGNTLETDEDVAYGATPSYNGETPTKTETEAYTYTFNGAWSPMILPVTGNTTYVAQFDATPKVTTLEIGATQTEDLEEEEMERTNLVITSNGLDASGQLLNAQNLTITGEAIFKLQPDGGYDAATWYAVAVPWTVSINGGIRNAAGSPLTTGDVYVIEFDANAYASADRENGRTDYWKFLDETGNDMQPGKLYMVYLRSAQTALHFHKKAGASIWTTSTSVAPASGSVAAQENWNAIANPSLFHADMTILNVDGDVLKYNGGDSYVIASSTDMVVGQPIFAQVTASGMVVATPASSPAPYRRALQKATDANNRFVVELTQNGRLADRLIVQTAEEKANEYVIGKDLAKMSVSTKVAQMWMERYNAKLCKNTVEMNGEYVNYPLTISAPAAGEYTIHLAPYASDSDYALYLTRNGEAVANLCDGDYTLYLNAGSVYEYGLRVSARAPQTTTGMDAAIIDAQGDTRKVLIDNKVFIIRGDKVYTIDGQMVK